MEFTLTIKDSELFIRKLRERPRQLISRITKAWQSTGMELIRMIVREQLSGRKGNKGLKRISGEAAKALNIRTQQKANDVVQKLFLLSGSPASKYLPYHDKSRNWDGIIRPKRKKFLRFKTSEIRSTSKSGRRLKRAKRVHSPYIFAKQVKIPVRTNILETYLKKTKPKLFKAIRQAVREVA